MPTIVMNPNHEAVQDMTDVWPQIAVMLMLKHGLKSVTITEEDLVNMPKDSCITIMEDHEGLHLTLVTMAEGIKLAKKHGGLSH